MTYFKKVEFKAAILNTARYHVGDGTQLGIGCLGVNGMKVLMHFDLHFFYPFAETHKVDCILSELETGRFYSFIGDAESFSDIPHENLTVFCKEYKEINIKALEIDVARSIIETIQDEDLYSLHETGERSLMRRYRKEQLFPSLD